jgi:hypothetical protein
VDRPDRADDRSRAGLADGRRAHLAAAFLIEGAGVAA